MTTIFPQKKKFGNKMYTKDKTFGSIYFFPRTVAKNYAKKLRKQKYLARVYCVKDNRTVHGMTFKERCVVYSRRKRN